MVKRQSACVATPRVGVGSERSGTSRTRGAHGEPFWPGGNAFIVCHSVGRRGRSVPGGTPFAVRFASGTVFLVVEASLSLPPTRTRRPPLDGNLCCVIEANRQPLECQPSIAHLRSLGAADDTYLGLSDGSGDPLEQRSRKPREFEVAAELHAARGGVDVLTSRPRRPREPPRQRRGVDAYTSRGYRIPFVHDRYRLSPVRSDTGKRTSPGHASRGRNRVPLVLRPYRRRVGSPRRRTVAGRQVRRR